MRCFCYMEEAEYRALPAPPRGVFFVHAPARLPWSELGAEPGDAVLLSLAAGEEDLLFAAGEAARSDVRLICLCAGGTPDPLHLTLLSAASAVYADAADFVRALAEEDPAAADASSTAALSSAPAVSSAAQEVPPRRAPAARGGSMPAEYASFLRRGDAFLAEGEEDEEYIMMSVAVRRYSSLVPLLGVETAAGALDKLAAQLKKRFRRPGTLFATVGFASYAVLTRARSCPTDFSGAALRSLPPALRDAVHIGYYRFTRAEADAQRAFMCACIARESAAEDTRAFSAPYNGILADRILAERRVTARLDEAMRSGAFTVFYQPLWNARAGRFTGAEALVRWRNPDGTTAYMPAEFIPVYEKTGFIVQLEWYVWEKVAAFLGRTVAAGRTPVPVSVNLSSRHFREPDFVGRLGDLLGRYGVPRTLVVPELSDIDTGENAAEAGRFVAALHEGGFRVLLDDFGSRNSSVDALLRIPFDGLKLDMSFVRGTEHTELSRRIAEGLVRMVRGAGIPVSVKGGDTERLCRFFASLGVDEIQGFYFSRPLPEEDFVRFLYEQEHVYPSVILRGETSFAAEEHTSLEEFARLAHGAVYRISAAEQTVREIYVRRDFSPLLADPMPAAAFFESLLSSVSAECRGEFLGRTAAAYLGEFLHSERCRESFAYTRGDGRRMRMTFLCPPGEREEWYLCLDDVTEEKDAVPYRSVRDHPSAPGSTDLLTGLSDRRAFTDAVLSALTAFPGNREVAFMIADIDRLSDFNNRHGHIVGDEILARFASLLEGFFTAGATVGRLGGDEFGVAVFGVRDRVAALHMAERFVALVGASSFAVAGRVTCSVGLACSSVVGRDFDALYAAADLALRSRTADGSVRDGGAG